MSRSLAIIGFVAILAAGMWGAVQVASVIPGAFSNLAAAVVSLTSIFVPAGEQITVTASPSLNVDSGQTVTLGWQHEKKTTEGSYTFRYDCANGVYFTSPASNGSQQTVYCNTPFNFLNSNDSLTLTAVSSQNRFADVTVHVDYTPNGSSRSTVTGAATLTVTNTDLSGSSVGTSTSTPSTPSTPTTPSTPSTPTTPTGHNNPGTQTSNTYTINAGQTSDPNGYVDLSARIIELGVVDKTTGAFTASSTPSQKERIAVRFAVENLGTKTSPTFDFAAVLPTIPMSIFNSPFQQALGPGDRIEFTIGFDSFNNTTATTTGTFTVNVDPGNRINEKVKTNNIVHYNIVTAPQ